MVSRTKTDVTGENGEHEQAAVAIAKAAKQGAPMLQRLASHRERIDLTLKELQSERAELMSRRDHLRRQAEAVEQGFALHLRDIESTLKLYEAGLNAVAVSETD